MPLEELCVDWQRERERERETGIEFSNRRNRGHK